MLFEIGHGEPLVGEQLEGEQLEGEQLGLCGGEEQYRVVLQGSFSVEDLQYNVEPEEGSSQGCSPVYSSSPSYTSFSPSYTSSSPSNSTSPPSYSSSSPT